MAATNEFLLKADAGILGAGDNAVGANADKGDNDWAPAFDFTLKALATGAKLVVREFIGARCGTRDDVRDTKSEVEKEVAFKGGKESWRKAAVVEGRPKAVTRPAEVAADGGGVEPGIDTGEEDKEIFGNEIRDSFVVRGKQLVLGRFPRGGQFPFHGPFI